MRGTTHPHVLKCATAAHCVRVARVITQLSDTKTPCDTPRSPSSRKGRRRVSRESHQRMVTRVRELEVRPSVPVMVNVIVYVPAAARLPLIRPFQDTVWAPARMGVRNRVRTFPFLLMTTIPVPAVVEM